MTHFYKPECPKCDSADYWCGAQVLRETRGGNIDMVKLVCGNCGRTVTVL